VRPNTGDAGRLNNGLPGAPSTQGEAMLLLGRWFDDAALKQFLGEADRKYLLEARVPTENGREHFHSDRRSDLRHVVELA
jgi:hypothetical protein